MQRIRVGRAGMVIRTRRRSRATRHRVQMSLVVALTGGAGFLASFLFLKAGMESMALRYPLAVLVAYLAFLFLLWLWLRSRRDDVAPEDWVDLVPTPDADLGSPASLPGPIRGGGGSFGGAGASGHYAPAMPIDPGSNPLEDLPLVGDAVGAAMDADEWAIPLLVILLVVCVAVASLYVVFLAPAIIGELVVDGALAYTLYRRLRRADTGDWLGAAVRSTVIPFAIVAVLLSVLGLAMQAVVPDADSIGDVIRRRG